jgi:hypothetical protein
MLWLLWHRIGSPDEGKVIHKRSGPQRTQMVNIKVNHPSWEPYVTPGKAVKGQTSLYSMMRQDGA